MIMELLSSLHKSDALIKKMVKKSATNSTNTAISDLDKIYIQLFLDVEAYGMQLRLLGIHTSSFEPYKNLLNCVSNGQEVIKLAEPKDEKILSNITKELPSLVPELPEL
jgi:hypothetical protein